MLKHFAFLLPAVLVLVAGCDESFVPDQENPLHRQFSGEKAHEHVRALVAFGPRPAGSPELEQSVGYLEEQLAVVGWQTRRQTFQEETPRGELSFTNLRARFGDGGSERLWKKRVRVLVGSHIDTKWMPDIRFVGANDSGSSTGALLELARVAAQRPEFARHLELVFFDGEEAIKKFTETDGLYGSRHYARNIIRPMPMRQRPEAMVLLDMVGERELSVRVPSDSPKELTSALLHASDELGFRQYFGVWPTPILDDHIPFQNEGMPAIDIIDFDFEEWHTPGDTLEVVSPRSLEITGQVTVRFLEKILTGDM